MSTPPAAAIVGLALFWLAMVVVFAFAAYAVLAAPFRRRERALRLLAIWGAANRRRTNVEHAILELFGSDRFTFGTSFATLARRIRKGAGVVEALRRVSKLVPRQIVEILGIGLCLGDIEKVLPACRQVLEDSKSNARGALNYFVLTVGGTVFFAPAVFLFIVGYIVPQFAKMYAEMGAELPSSLRLFTHPAIQWWSLVASVVALFLYVSYATGLRFFAFLPGRWFGEGLAYLLPWRRARLLRDFASVLSVLLDAGAPEDEAVLLAAQGTANWIIMNNASVAVNRLQQGMTLAEALLCVDSRGELRWRIENAAHATGGFRRALEGWCRALDAEADRSAQATAHVVTTAAVICTGATAGLFAFAIVQCLVGLVYGMSPW